MSTSHSHRHHDDHAHDKEHSHGHHHHGHHHHAPASYNRAFAVGISLNIGFVAIEAFFGWQADSLALLADAGHNLSDVLGLILAWSAMFVGQLQGTDRHTYGWRRASILAALINAIVLLVAMGAMAWEAIHRLQQPVVVAGATMMWVAGIGVIINGITAWFFMRGSDDINIRGAFLHMAADALVSLGVVVAGFAYLVCGWAWLDPVMSLIIALVIISGTWGLLRQSLHLSLDGVPEHIHLADVRQYLLSLPDVSAVHDLHIWAMSSSEVALTVHLVMPEGRGYDGFLQAVTEELHDHYHIEHPTIQIVAAPFTKSCSSPSPSPLPKEQHSH